MTMSFPPAACRCVWHNEQATVRWAPARRKSESRSWLNRDGGFQSADVWQREQSVTPLADANWPP
jgi:hypothetical protein